MKHLKFIEFYDVRAAEAALRALNRIEFAGKQIKLEPGHPRFATRWLYPLPFSYFFVSRICGISFNDFRQFTLDMHIYDRSS